MYPMSKVIRRTVMVALAVMLVSSGVVVAQENQPPTPGPEPAMIVDINTAPVEQLERIPLDDLLVQRIIENRPFANKRQLVSRNLISLEEYDKIKDRIIARRVVTPDPQ